MTGPGYGVYDYVKLEVDIRTNVMAPCEMKLALETDHQAALESLFDQISNFEKSTWHHASSLTFDLDPGRASIMRAASQACSLLRERAFEAGINPALYQAMFMIYAARASAFNMPLESRIWAVAAANAAADFRDCG